MHKAGRLDLLFAFAKVDNGTVFRSFDYHLGAAYVRAFAESKGWETSQFLSEGCESLPTLARDIAALSPNVLGFSCYDSNLYLSALLAGEVRRIAPDIKIIFGGPTATFSAEKVMRFYPVFDAAVRSYGEEATVSYLERVQFGDSRLSEVAGLTWRSGTGIVSNPDRVLPPNREQQIGFDLPSANTLDRYVDPYLAGLIPTERVSDLGIITSRGCAFPCTFCNFAAMSSRKVREHSLSHVHRVLRHISDTQAQAHPGEVRRVAINDDNFSTNAPRMRQLLQGIQENYPNLEFWAEMRVDSLTEADFELMEAAGFKEINIGLDSASPRVIRAAQKIPLLKNSPPDFGREERYRETIRQATSWAKNCNITCCVSVILGLPDEDHSDGLQTIDFISQTQVPKYAHNFLQVFDGTPIADDFGRFGITVEQYPGRILPNITYPNYPTFNLPVLESDESQLPYRRQVVESTATLISGVFSEARSTSPKSFGRGSTVKASSEPASTTTLIAFTPGALRNSVRHLASLLPMRAIGWVVHRNFRLKNAYRKFLSQGIPLQEVNFLEMGADTAALNRPDRRFGGRPVALLASRVTQQQGSFRVVDLASKAAVDNLLRELKFSESSRTWTFREEHLREPIIVLDACRWIHRPCPSPSGVRLLIGGKGVIKSCARDPGVNSLVAVSLDGLRRARTEQANYSQQRRACSSCDARERCSMCHTPIEGSQDSFCEIKRDCLDIESVVSSTEVLRRLVAQGRIEADVHVQARVISIGKAFGSVFGSQREAILLQQAGSAGGILAFGSEDTFAVDADTLEAILALSSS